MKKFWVIIIIFFLFIFFLFSQKQQPIVNPEVKISNTPTPIIIPKTEIKSTDIRQALFVPDWTFSKNAIDENYDQYIYFGINTNLDGIEKNDISFEKINTFLSSVPISKSKILTVKMLDDKINSKLLTDKNFQIAIANESSNVAKQNEFDGILLDFELKALSFDTVIKNVSDISKTFAQIIHKNNLKFYMTIYGDTFYNLKPYDLAAISKNIDGIYIMAYDFHKSRGNPGPNFPFTDTKDGYDFKVMISDFEKKVHVSKLTIVFGLFGYDWTVDDKNQSISTATALSYITIKQKFLDKCDFKDCEIVKDKESAESKITYEDKDGQKHIIWFEDPNSVSIKENYAKSQGISFFATWAYSYF